jgi:hypothetical protein
MLPIYYGGERRMRRKYLSNFNSPTPREVPLSVRLWVLFGGFYNQFGWLFFGFGMIFVWSFAVHTDIASIVLFRLQTRTTVGIVKSVQSKNATENNLPIYEVKYVYFDTLGKQHNGVSYSTGEPRVETRVTVEYMNDFPSISRVEGMRREIFSPWAVFSILFPLIGLGFLYVGIKHGVKADRLLSEGKIAFGKLISTERTATRINNRPVLKLTFNFRAEDGLDYDVTAKTHEPEDLRDELEEPLLYNPNAPFTTVLLDNLPGSTEFDSSGRLVPASIKDTVKVLILPVLTMLGHGIYLLLILFGPL